MGLETTCDPADAGAEVLVARSEATRQSLAFSVLDLIAMRAGTLILDMYDAGSEQLVWTGQATKTIDPNSNPEKNLKNLDKATAKLLKNYPPKQK